MVASTEPQGFTAEDYAIFEKLNIGTEGGLPLPAFIKPSEVVELARPLARSIFEDWQVLKSVVGPNEGRLLERWKGMKKKRRVDLLCETWGSIPPESSQPHLELWKNSKEHEGAGKIWTEREREAFMWPNINLEDLSKARPLWLMMKVRSRVSPGTFATADLEWTTLGKMCRALTPRYLNKYSMAFTGGTSPETYGQLFSWDEFASDEDSNRCDLIHPGEGLFILTIQARLYSFLREISTKILGSTELDATPSATIKPELDDSFGVPEADFVDLAASLFEDSYSRPPAMRLQRLIDYASAKLTECEDQLWALREDPSHFAAALRSWKEHRREVVAESSGNTHLALRDREMIWPRAVNACVKEAMEQIGTWNAINTKVRFVAQQMEKHGAEVKPDAALPRDLALTLYSLQQHLSHFEKDSVSTLGIGAFASPPLRRYFNSVVSKGEQGETTIALEASSEVPDEATADIIWTLTELQDAQRHQVVSRLVLNHLEQTLHSSSRSRECVSSWVASQLSTSALMTTLLKEIDCFQPWVRSFSAEMREEDTAEVLSSDMGHTMQQLNPLLGYVISPRIAALAIPDDGRFDADSSHAQTPEAALDAFWTKLQSSLERHKALPQWVRAVLERSTATRAPTGDSQSAASPAAAKRKPTTAQKPLRVSKRCLRIFRALFHDPSATASRSSTPAEITWLDFVHAMHAGAGFAVTKLYGSAWLFVPPAPTAGGGSRAAPRRPSLFEEPWGQAKVPAGTARWIGRRLGRAYGWGAESFELAE